MNEHLLQFIWQYQYFNKSALVTANNEPVEIISPGFLNTNQGPDFSNARVKIGKTIWAGAVEIHLKSSDWLRHGHNTDCSYSNTILHVVYENDRQPNDIPIVELKDRIAMGLLNKYDELMHSKWFIPCEKLISNAKPITLTLWKERLVAERLIRKADYIESDLKKNRQDWEETFWWLLAKHFGTNVNGEAFEEVAKTVRLRILAKHRHQLIQLEAMLLGQAGLLNQQFHEKYAILLQKEYAFLKSKYTIIPGSFPVHFLRLRPQNFPTLRLAQLAALIHQSHRLFSKIIEEPSLETVKKWFYIFPNDFWNYHYTLIDEPCFKKKPLGRNMIDNLIINVVVPVLFTYGRLYKNETIRDKALHWLEEVKPEKNKITRGFQNIGVQSKTAWDSQSLIELKNRYCNDKMCLHCAIGNAIIKL